MDAPTADAKRKRTDADTDVAHVVEEASDAEVEEFYAILRRMRDASRRFVSRAGAGGRAGLARAPAWRPSFSWEDFAPPAAPTTTAPSTQQQQQQQQRSTVDERVAENATPSRVTLDLNAEPEPEASATPRP
ncbi:protein NEGATIVE REGULATOR OF RESISTANCE-like [Lolium rigidum]|uniref:protein NEGATIVE REGULATOR OF RESISTANCE-like n=1 Tax=Lolium rigidum TaxID=89674 RepID=UPI001F5C8C33|nr:protein NEGATIVE REGULATOR OF RESISTANCE-like [Lolium rigidum]